ncbi:uncharacterized protein LOC129965559 [Argiope bruennichi]|uniref:E3 ubiquitin-protein ligase RNF165 like protein n=1 Tax=Argiope bruennichi TaxID=94029 RepID=A0A8T0E546_ARGBR|nr:uncharacterized protein LOC129965559 [Argiope bruennichi]KAF8766959.1 E3 ubiquitin-protein ligase RNF165 like protein [Argiope bruennichi]
MGSIRKRKHSSAASANRAASSVLTVTNANMQKKSRKHSRCSDFVNNVTKEESSATAQDASKGEKDHLPSTDIPTEYKCSICLDTTLRKKMKRLPCSHIFHRSCINKWLKNHRRCPLCRVAITYPRNKRSTTNRRPTTNRRYYSETTNRRRTVNRRPSANRRPFYSRHPAQVPLSNRLQPGMSNDFLLNVFFDLCYRFRNCLRFI